MSNLPEAAPLHTRDIALIHPYGDGASILVQHVYAPDGSGWHYAEDGGSASHDPAPVAVTMTDGEGQATTLMSAENALLLANRLTRAASLVLESGEQRPDVEREAARFAAQGTAGP